MTLAVQSWGEGRTPLVFLHGFTGSGGAFDHLRPYLGTSFRIRAPDLPGHGESPAATSWDAAIDALSAALGSESFALAGYSMGARLALAFALRHPERVVRLILESGSPGLASEEERGRRRAEDEEQIALLERAGLEAFLDRWEAHPTLSSLRNLPQELAAALRARRRANTAAGLASALRALGAGAQPSLWEELPHLRAPTLLLAGERDAKFVEIAREMAKLAPRATLRLVPGSGHAPHLEVPRDYAEALVSFATAERVVS